MRFGKPNRLLYKIFILISLVICIIVFIYLIGKINPELVLFGDYIQYWASGKLLIRGDNPYSWDLIKNIKIGVGHINPIDDITPSMFRYPPWSLIFVIPIGYMEYPISRVVWLLSNILIIFVSSILLWKVFGGKEKYRWLAVLIAFILAPTIFVLGIGHFTTLHLLGVTLFLYFINNHRGDTKKSDFIAGFFSSLVSIKPNVLILFLLSLVMWAIIKKRWFILYGFLAFTTLGLAVVNIYNNQIILEYWEVISHYSPGLWATPTLGMLLRHFLSLELTWLLVIPTIIGIVWLFYYFRNNLYEWDWINEISIITLLSFVFSPYFWTYDMVVILIPIIYVFAKLSTYELKTATIIISLAYILLNIITYLFHINYHDFWFFWLAPTYLIWFLFGIKYSKKYSRTLSRTLQI